MKNKWNYLIGLLVVGGLLFFSSGCKKDTIYDVNPVNVSQNGGNKSNVKSTLEFIAIAYSDLFGTNISQTDLVELNQVYSAFGDKKIIEDRIVRNFLNKPGVQVPVLPNVNGDTISFINVTYKKLYNREPNAFESYYLKEQIRLNSVLKPIVVYYALMTSDEYRYF